MISFEPHYWNIKRQIIAEEYLYDTYNSTFSSSLIDYKFWCIHGEPVIIVVMCNRKNQIIGAQKMKDNRKFYAYTYDLDWNLRTDILTDFPLENNSLNLPKPKCLKDMIEVFKVLSKPFPTVRVDLYEVNDRVYFGEMTFTPGGNLNYFTEEFFLQMGEKINLSMVKPKMKKWF